MLRNTFIHLPHIGCSTEERLWRNGIISWSDILENKNEYAEKFNHIRSLLKLSEHKLRLKNVRFFTDRLTTDQHWRVFHDFLDSIAYIDIETTGLGGPNDYITTISLYDGKKIYTFIHDKNIKQFKQAIKKYKVIVTFNGKCFDVPFIEREFGIQLNQAHLDLRYILKSLGYSGGLKSCEHQLGLARGDLEGVNGYFAVLLWKDYCNGNKKALDTLLAYNIVDTVNLEKLMMYAFKKKLEQLSLDEKAIASLKTITMNAKKIQMPFKPDHPTINRIKKKYY